MSDPVNFITPTWFNDPFKEEVDDPIDWSNCDIPQTRLMKLNSFNSRDIFPLNNSCTYNTTMEVYVNLTEALSNNVSVCQLTNTTTNDIYIASELKYPQQQIDDGGPKIQCDLLATKQASIGTDKWKGKVCIFKNSLDNNTNKWECK